MKKIISLFLVMIMLLSITACSGRQADADTSSIVSNNNRNIFITEDNENIYFSCGDAVKKMSKADDTVADIYVAETEDAYPRDIQCLDGRLYWLAKNRILYSADTDGNNLKQADISFYPTENIPDMWGLPSFYTYNGILYLVSGYTLIPYSINPDTLALERAEKDIRFMYIADDGGEYNAKARFYKNDGDEKITLSPEVGGSLLYNRINYSQDYIFFAFVETSDTPKATLYRVDISGENKIAVKDFNIDEQCDLQYDNQYVYLKAENSFIRIDKCTLEQKDITDIVNPYEYTYDVADGKFFQLLEAPAYYIDVETGIKTDI